MYEKGQAGRGRGRGRGRWHPRSQKFSNKGLVTITWWAFRKLAREWSPCRHCRQNNLRSTNEWRFVRERVASGRDRDNDKDFTRPRTRVGEIMLVLLFDCQQNDWTRKNFSNVYLRECTKTTHATMKRFISIVKTRTRIKIYFIRFPSSSYENVSLWGITNIQRKRLFRDFFH